MRPWAEIAQHAEPARLYHCERTHTRRVLERIAKCDGTAEGVSDNVDGLAAVSQSRADRRGCVAQSIRKVLGPGRLVAVPRKIDGDAAAAAERGRVGSPDVPARRRAVNEDHRSG